MHSGYCITIRRTGFDPPRQRDAWPKTRPTEHAPCVRFRLAPRCAAKRLQAALLLIFTRMTIEGTDTNGDRAREIMSVSKRKFFRVGRLVRENDPTRDYLRRDNSRLGLVTFFL